MTTLSSAVPARAGLTVSQPWPSGPVPRLAAQGAAFILALALPLALAAMLDTRTIAGISIWVKPLKFSASIALHLLTIGLLAGLLNRAARDGWWIRTWTVLAVVASLGEMIYIATQAARGRASHFNLETPFEATAYGIMGIGAVAMVTATLVLGVAIRQQARPDVAAGLRLGAVVGLVAGSAATLVTAGVLGANEGHWVGGIRSDLGGLPIVGWSTTGGDLRVAHFFATHAMQGLPLVGLIADRLVPTRARAAVIAATVVWLAIVVATFLQAQAGLPLLRLP